MVNTLGTSTIALLTKESWLRHWLYHGSHLLFGVAGLEPVLRGDPGAITYSHEITAVLDAGGLLLALFGFLVISAIDSALMGVLVWSELDTGPGNPRRGGGDPPKPDPAPHPSGGAGLDAATDDVSSVLALSHLQEPDPGVEHDRVLVSIDSGYPLTVEVEGVS
ncbi:MAG: hypothetical protein ACLPTB_16085 [Acidimicrobiales bacterium]